MSISSGVMSKNDLDMLLLGMPVGELILLQLGLSSNPQGANNLEIDVVGYAKSISGLSNEAAYNLLSDAAKSLFHRHFSYKHDSYETATSFLFGFSGNEDEYKLNITLSDSFFKAINNVGVSTVKEMLDTYIQSPLSKLERAYSAKLYLLLTNDDSSSDSVIIDYERLRSELGLDADAYSLIQNFKKRILNIAINDINELTLLDVDYTDIMDNRKITGFKFTVKSKEVSK